MRSLYFLVPCASLFLCVWGQCTSDEDCNLNGICASNNTCECDAGWVAADCGQLDRRKATRGSGYNLTGKGTSSWGSKIVHDPHDQSVFHLFAAEFTHGCGLDYWSPYSRVIRAKSTTGPAGLYQFEAEIVGTFAHNPTVVYSEANRLYLLYNIGCSINVPDGCQYVNFSCGPGNNLNGESGISLWSSPDLYQWTSHGQVLSGDRNGTWDTDTTNPSPFPLFSWGDKSSEILLAYRGCPYNGGTELLGVASAPSFTGPYERASPNPIFSWHQEDPFVWRDRRGNFHMLTHSVLPDGGFGSGPNVGRHAFARYWMGPWTFNDNTVAYNTTVEFTDGTTIIYYRRERPQLFFSEDGMMTPLFLTNGVQERNSNDSYSLIQPIGDGAAAYEQAWGLWL